MEDYIKELQFLPKVSFVSLNANTDALIPSLQDTEESTDLE